MVFAVEMNKDTSPTSLTDTASEAESIKQNGDGSKSRKVCCQVMGVVIGLILIATILPLFICSFHHHKRSVRESIEICWDKFLVSVHAIGTTAGCRVTGENGNGTKRDTCSYGEFCYANGNCGTGYVYAEEKECSGRRIGHRTSLQAARDYCNTDKECACIHDENCDGSYWHMYSGQPTTSNSYCSWTKNCSNPDGVIGFYHSHAGYWYNGYKDGYPGYISMGSQTITECANSCIQGCVAFNRNYKTCYHYFESSDLVDAYKINESDNKAYIKCIGT